MNPDDVRSDTIEAEYDQLEQIASMLGAGHTISADRLVIETQDTKLEITSTGGSLEVGEIE